MDLETELAKLKGLFDKGLIDETEYRESKKSLLSSALPSGSPPPSGTQPPQGTALSLSEGMVIGPGAERLFRLDKRLGGGAMGEVWKAEDLAESKLIGQPKWVAIKALIPFLSAGERHREALKREAINAKNLTHPGIIRIHDWYEDKAGGFPFLVMEYLEGKTLDAILAQEGPFNLERTLATLTPIVEALTYAWDEHKIVHRDLKPENIYITQEGRIKLLDFGIAAQARDTATSTGLIGFDSPGTLGYAPPEAGARQKPTPKLDIYALGILTYELLEGALPFQGMRNREHQPMKPDALDEAQWQTVQKAMAYDAGDRYEVTREYLASLSGPSVVEIARRREEAEAAVRVAEEARVKAETEAERKARQAKEEQEKVQAEAKRLKDELERKQQDETAEPSAKKATNFTPIWVAAGVLLVAGVIAAGGLGGKQDAAPAPAPTPASAQAPEVVPAPAPPRATLPSPAPATAPSPSAAAPAPSFRAGQVIKDCAECPEMVVIPSGSFQMGSNEGGSEEKPVHTVNITRPFALGKTEVTQGQWRAVMGNNPSDFSGCGDSCPVDQVNWNDAQDFIRKLNLKTGKQYRLPSEAEWEYAARAGTRSPFHTGACIRYDQANVFHFESYNDCESGSMSDVSRGTVPVGRYKANSFGIYDMHGNVFEWVEDCWNETYTAAPIDGSAWKSGDCSHRILRGGGWALSAGYARSAARFTVEYSASRYKHNIGFRLAKTLP